MADGRVLIAGGYDGAAVAYCEIYDPATNAVTLASAMPDGKARFAMVLLDDGRVLAVGGTASSSSYIYDPTDGTWGNTAAMVGIYGDNDYPECGAVRLVSGNVLASSSDAFGMTCLWSKATNTWAAAGTPSGTYMRTSAVMARLSDGSVLRTGGSDENSSASGVCRVYTEGVGWAAANALSVPRAYLGLGGCGKM